MDLALSFDDVLIKPQWSTIRSRKDVQVNTTVAGQKMNIGLLSSNMDSVTDSNMSRAMVSAGGRGVLHRFWDIDTNVKAFFNSPFATWCSVGVGDLELERACALEAAGCGWIVLDVAHGAAEHVVDQVNLLTQAIPNVNLIVGNFATSKSINDFNYHLGFSVSAYKCNIGSGSSCITRTVTGCGLPSFTSLLDCVSSGFDIIQDGGIKNSGDFAKAMGVGAKACILGGMLAGCDESPTSFVNASGKPFSKDMEGLFTHIQRYKRYRGSASQESYEVQGKVADHRTNEGESFLVPYSGPVSGVINKLEAGLRSAMSYTNSHNLDEFKNHCEFIKITGNGALESKAHGRHD